MIAYRILNFAIRFTVGFFDAHSSVAYLLYFSATVYNPNVRYYVY